MVKNILNKNIQPRLILPIILLVSFLMGGFFCVDNLQAMASKSHERIDGDTHYIPVHGNTDNESAHNDNHHSIDIAKNPQQSFSQIFSLSGNLTTDQLTNPRTLLSHFQPSFYSLSKAEFNPLNVILRC